MLSATCIRSEDRSIYVVMLCPLENAVFVVSGTLSTRLTWFQLLINYGQETTMHGVRYITDRKSFHCRRLRQELVTYHIINFNNWKTANTRNSFFLSVPTWVFFYIHPLPF